MWNFEDGLGSPTDPFPAAALALSLEIQGLVQAESTEAEAPCPAVVTTWQQAGSTTQRYHGVSPQKRQGVTAAETLQP